MTTERVRNLIAPLTQPIPNGFTIDEVNTFADLNDEELGYLAAFRGQNGRTILHRFVASGQGLSGEQEVSTTIKQNFFTKLNKLLGNMHHLSPEDAVKLAPKLLNNKNLQFARRLVMAATSANLQWIFNHLPTLATHIDTPERTSRTRDLQDRGLSLPSLGDIYLNSRRSSILQNELRTARSELESARSVRDHASRELDSMRKQLHAAQKQSETYQRERDEARTEVQKLKSQVTSLTLEKLKIKQEQQALNTKYIALQTQYSAAQRNIAQLNKTIETNGLKLREVEKKLLAAESMNQEFSNLKIEHNSLRDTHEKLKAEFQRANEKIRTIEDELTSTIAATEQLRLENSTLNSDSSALKLKLDLATTRLQGLPKVMNFFKLAMQGLEFANNGAHISGDGEHQQPSALIPPIGPSPHSEGSHDSVSPRNVLKLQISTRTNSSNSDTGVQNGGLFSPNSRKRKTLASKDLEQRTDVDKRSRVEDSSDSRNGDAHQEVSSVFASAGQN
jgi:predicted  nucleic acid-binding Zn-ribbon protein